MPRFHHHARIYPSAVDACARSFRGYDEQDVQTLTSTSIVRCPTDTSRRNTPTRGWLVASGQRRPSNLLIFNGGADLWRILWWLRLRHWIRPCR